MVGVVCWFVVVGFQGKVAVPAGIDAIYRLQTDQVRKGDWKGFFATYDPKFVYTDASGKRFGLDAFKKQVLEMFRPTNKREVTMTYKGLKTSGDVSSVSYVCDFALTSHGKKTVYREVATDTWRKTAHGWREISCVDKSFGEVKAK